MILWACLEISENSDATRQLFSFDETTFIRARSAFINISIRPIIFITSCATATGVKIIIKIDTYFLVLWISFVLSSS